MGWGLIRIVRKHIDPPQSQMGFEDNRTLSPRELALV